MGRIPWEAVSSFLCLASVVSQPQQALASWAVFQGLFFHLFSVCCPVDKFGWVHRFRLMWAGLRFRGGWAAGWLRGEVRKVGSPQNPSYLRLRPASELGWYALAPYPGGAWVPAVWLGPCAERTCPPREEEGVWVPGTNVIILASEPSHYLQLVSIIFVKSRL